MVAPSWIGTFYNKRYNAAVNLINSPERIHGAVERITFHSDDTGFTVLRVRVRGRRELATVVGTVPSVSQGESVECSGSWTNDRKHGMQFQADTIRVIPPATVEGMERYLGSGMVKGIGPHFARKLVEAFGDAVFDIIENRPARLLELPGIGRKRLEAVTRAWAEQKAIREIMVFLQSHKVGPARAVRIYKTYGDDAVRLVTENPYRLSGEIHGIGFLTADGIAGSLGIEKESPLRAEAGVVHILQEFVGRGHCCVPRTELTERCMELLEIPDEVVSTAIIEGIRRTVLFEEEVGGEPCIWLTSLRNAEIEVATRLLALREGHAPWQPIDGSKALPWVEEKTGTVLARSQKEAAAGALRHKVMVITGGPGVGKTTLVRSVLRIVAAKKGRILLCAPTGRAAKRLSESTGMEARTIHRLLEFDPVTGGFKRGADRPLAADLVVLDEASMVDVVLMSQFLAALPDSTALLMVGDIDQIPSVGPGSVLRDIIASGAVPVATLTEIFRQADASEIILNAHRVNRGEMPRNGEKDFFTIKADAPEEILEALLHVVLERIPRRFGLDPSRDIQVLTPMNRGALGARSLNLELQQRMNPNSSGGIQRFGSSFSSGDKVIQTVNDYDKEVFNGDIGIIRVAEPATGRVEIDFDGRRVPYEAGELDSIALAYAITIHKSQGSEYPAVVMPVSTQHYVMLQRNLLYTGLTRGKKLVVLIGQPRAFSTAADTASTVERRTALRGRLIPARTGSI